MFCTQCGIELEEKHMYCYKCGKATAANVPPPRAFAQMKRLVRPMAEKKIAGVCAGFAHYFAMDVVLIRIIWLMLAILWGFGFLAYVVCWIAMPREESSFAAASQPASQPAA